MKDTYYIIIDPQETPRTATIEKGGRKAVLIVARTLEEAAALYKQTKEGTTA
nr:hypothetical protein [uncultured Dysosmobacter sp.]